MSRPGERIDRRLKAWLKTSKNDDVWWLVLASSPDRWQRAIANGCAEFGLDASNPAHRETLFGILAEVHFGVASNALTRPLGDPYPKPMGRPVKWSKIRGTRLRRHFVAVVPEFMDTTKRLPRVPDIAKRLRQEFPEEYGGLKLSTLGQYIRKECYPQNS
jgi:hypothetical protein